jgi:hypothetical protein
MLRQQRVGRAAPCDDGVHSHNGTGNHTEFTGFQDGIEASFGGSKKEWTFALFNTMK